MKDETQITLVIIFIVMLFVGLIVGVYYEGYARDESCKRIGFVESRESNGFNLCKDIDGNLHYVEFISDGLFNYKAKEISVGGVRIANE